MSRTRFCAECGKTSVALAENFCQTCYWKFHNLAKLKSGRVDLPYCLECGSIKLSTGWSGANHQYEIPEIIAFAFINTLSASPSAIIDVENITDLNWLNPNPEFVITYSVESDEIVEFEPHREYHDLEVKILGGSCTTCVKKKTGSGDVTVQFRAQNRKLSQKEIDTATTLAFSHASEMTYESQDAYLSDIVELYGGLDFIFGNDAVADAFIASIKKQWIGHYEKNFKLVTEDREERRVYAVTHLFRIPEVQENDLIEINKEIHEVRHVSRAGVHVMSLTGHKRSIIKDWKELKQIDPPPYLERMMVVSENMAGHSYLVMDLKSYESREYHMDRFPMPLTSGEEYDFLLWEDKIYLSPGYTIGETHA